ncbi:MAG: TerB family tellurite resistance protein [Desulfobacter sp.]|nr:TerB family tellurite resistance protein [Desulfobacter sp.]WDP84126.1 MAG: TerB family tellurite resistance protein [Desulfobacter sp.]
MFDLIKKMISTGKDSTPATDEDALTAHLALTVLLLEAAYADGECSEQEKEHLAETLVANFDISPNDIHTLINDSRKERKEYVNLFRYTHFINDNFNEKQKMDIMESVWRIILLNNHLEAHEDHFAHKLATLLRLGHKDLIDAKLRARKQLS